MTWSATPGSSRFRSLAEAIRRRSRRYTRRCLSSRGSTPMICIIHAHPYLSRSRTNRALVNAISAIPDADLRSLYDLYPDFDIDVGAEQRALTGARLILWM